MGKNRFVKAAATVKIDISDGDWIEIKERLSYGEEQRLASSMFGNWIPGQVGENEVAMNMANHSIAKILIWLVDWSFVGEKGKSVPINRDSVSELDPETANEIQAIIDAHVAALGEAKKVTAG